MYRLSRKQLMLFALVPALLSGLIVSCAQRIMEQSNATVETHAIADPTVATDEQNNIEIYRKLSPGVVHITSTSLVRGWFGVYPSEGTGSGSIIDEKGHILTNYHVVRGSRQLDVQVEDEKYAARVIGTDPDNDLAVIKIDIRANAAVVPMGTSNGLLVGQKVLAIGNPFGLQRTLTTGIISGLERPLREPGGRTIEGAIQTDASINPGNSGGPLLNARGEMIGINTAIYSPSGGSVGIGFAVPVDIAKRIVPALIARGYVSRPWLGIQTTQVDRRIARAFGLSVTRGAMVTGVYRGSGAAAAGLRAAATAESLFGDTYIERAGDVIIAIDGNDINRNEDLQRVLADKKPGQVVQVQLIRQNSTITVPVRLSERPQQGN